MFNDNWCKTELRCNDLNLDSTKWGSLTTHIFPNCTWKTENLKKPRLRQSLKAFHVHFPDPVFLPIQQRIDITKSMYLSWEERHLNNSAVSFNKIFRIIQKCSTTLPLTFHLYWRSRWTSLKKGQILNFPQDWM